MLTSNQVVHIFSFDFIKAFDTVLPSTRMSKVAQLPIPHNIYNWIKYFFEKHDQYIIYAERCFSVAEVKKVIVIEGSGR